MVPTFNPLQLVHAHLPPPPPIPHPIPTLRVPSERPYPADAVTLTEPLHPDHAASTAYHPATGILARAIHNGFVLELRTLSTVVNKRLSADGPGSEIVRIHFPDRLAPLVNSCIMPVRRDGRLYILVVTQARMVYRLAFPYGSFHPASGDRFVFTTSGSDDWSEEYEIPEEVLGKQGDIGAWMVLDQDTVVLDGSDGGMTMLSRSGGGNSVEWTAAAYRAPSRFRLPLFSRNAGDEQIISFASSVHADSSTYIYALSRNAQLRVWDAVSGACLRTVDFRSATSPSQDVVLRDGQQSSTVGSSSRAHAADGVPFIRCIPHHSSSSRYSHILIAFVSTPYSPASAGAFTIYRVSVTSGVVELTPGGTRPASRQSTGCQLRGFEVLPPVDKTSRASGWRLFVSWDQQGSVACETVDMDDIFQFATYLGPSSGSVPPEWQSTSVEDETDQLDAAYFDGVIASDCPNPADPEDNSDIALAFTSHLFHPGRFSSLTLETALDEYIAGLPRSQYDSTLTAQYRSLDVKFSSIVGSYLALSLDPNTGAPMTAAYRSDLKRDWLGVWARVRDLDKQARWPVGTAMIDAQVVVLAREGLSAGTPQDSALVLLHAGSDSSASEQLLALPAAAFPRHLSGLVDSDTRRALLAVVTAGTQLSSFLSDQPSTSDEGSCLDAFTVQLNNTLALGLQQPVVDVILELWQEHMEPCTTENIMGPIRRQLSASLNVPESITSLLLLLNSFDVGTSGTAIADLAFSGFGNSLVAAAVSRSINARYELASAALLVAILEFVSGQKVEEFDGSTWDEEMSELLSECLVVYHRYRVLKWVTEQTGQEAAGRSQKDRRDKKRKHGLTADDSLTEGLGGLRMKSNSEPETDGVDPSYSLLHSLLARQLPQAVPRAPLQAISEASAAVLRVLGLFDAESKMYDLEAAEADARLALAVLTDGHPTLAGELSALYPLDASMAYIKGRAYAELGVIDESVKSFEQAVSACRDGSLQLLVPELRCVFSRDDTYDSTEPYEQYHQNKLADQEDSDPTGSYFKHLVQVFSDLGQDGPVAHFGQLALRSGDSAQKNTELWTKVFLANVALGQYEEAYSVLASTPSMTLKRDFLGQLISVMCEHYEVGRLNSLGFVGMQKDVEALLSFKARNSDPLRFPNYYKVLYSWHISRGDYRSAGEIMFLQARRLGAASNQRGQDFELATLQARSYLAAINALSLVDKRNAWVAVPAHAAGHPAKDAKRRRVSSYIPEEEFASDRKPIDIVTIGDIQEEYTLVLSQLRLASQSTQGVSLSPEEAVGLLVKQSRFDEAQAAASSMSVDMTDLFVALATQCVDLSRSAISSLDGPSAAFLRSSTITSRLRGPSAALCLRYLEVSLARHDTAKTQYKYRAVVADTLFKLNDDERYGWVMPSWLVEWEMQRDPEGWIARALKWGWVKEARGWAARLLQEATPPEVLPKDRSFPAFTPYTLFDRVLAPADDKDQEESLRREVQQRIKRLS